MWGTEQTEIQAFQAHPVLQAAESFRSGGLSVVLPGGDRLFYKGQETGTTADLRIHDREALDYIASHGDIGFGEGYMLGLWDTANIKSLTRLLAENIDAMENYVHGMSFYKMFYALKNRLFSNTLKGCREHLDLGNDFYRLWLDDSMSYSGGLFCGDVDMSLEDAQMANYRRILSRLQASPNDHILDIGCGWGGFMQVAAKQGFQVTGITVSPSQTELAKERLTRGGFSHSTHVMQQDYREVTGEYDHVVSIGMMEHVGEEFWREYMRKIYASLRPKGRGVVQTIVIRDDLFDGYRKGSDFIREHIFPGGMLPSAPRFMQEAEKAGLHVNDVFRFGEDYAITLEKWLERFDDNLLEISSLGYSEEFIRKWRLYLSTSAAMFRVGRIDLLQVEMSKS